MTRRGAFGVFTIVGIGAVGGILWWRSHPGVRAAVVSGRTWSPLSRRVVVEVLNGSKTGGMARVGTVMLREAGLDVVFFGNADSSLGGHGIARILVRRGDTIGTGRVIEALGGGDVADVPDAARMVDLSVVLGQGFRGRPVK